MTTTIKARFSHGVLEPLEKLDLPEGKEIVVTIEDKWHIPVVSDKEQEDIEKALKDPDCHVVAKVKTVIVEV